MKHLLIVFDSVRYDRFMKAYAPNLKSLGRVVKAYSHGRWTRPSMTSILSGYLPRSELGQIYKPSGIMCGREMFHNQNIPSFFIHSNAWVYRMHPSRYVEKFFDICMAREMVAYTLKIMETHKNYFICILFTETHIPYTNNFDKNTETFIKMVEKYNKGIDNNADKTAIKRQIKMIEYLDKTIKPLLSHPEKIIFTSDHGELQGEHHLVGHDPTYPFHIKLFEVPLIIS